VVITFYKTDQPTAAQFLQCTCAVSFGGQNDNRIFFAGNATSYYYWSDATRPEYIPISQYNLLGSNDDEITGFGLQNDTLVIFKSRSIYGVTYSWDDTTATAYFPCVNLNASIGCDCPGTIALINNRLTWLASYAGVFTLVNQTMTGTTAGVYRNVNPISRNINGNGSRSGLLQEANLTSAAAVDFGRKYWIAVNGHVWLWDYGMTPYSSGADLDAAQEALSWWYFDSLNIACFAQDGTDLYFGDTVSGYIVHFENSFADNGAAIDASWKMKINHLGLPNELKTVTKLWLSCRADTSTTLNINYYTDTQPDGVADAQPILISSFDLSQFDLSSFCLGVSNWFGEYLKKPPIKNCQAFSVEFTNGTPAQDLNVSDVIIAYIPVKEVKRSV
jgi:hypothetical protein